tara:strand:+ start:133 stop:666 length:534 start_codon:yes stop_codon:yes gene_type:complete
MKTKLLDNVITSDELFFIYNEIISTPMWNMTALSSYVEEESWDKKFNKGPNLLVKSDEKIFNHPFYFWGKTIIYRIKEKNIGIKSNIFRMWFNITYSDNTNHFLHMDANDESLTSVVLFLTPIWNPEWKGSFYVDGEKFNFKSGSAVIFNSKEYHMGEAPEKNTHGWMRLSCNIVLK